jgi:hypothetical protein
VESEEKPIIRAINVPKIANLFVIVKTGGYIGEGSF